MGRAREQHSNAIYTGHRGKAAAGDCGTGIRSLRQKATETFINMNNDLQHLEVRKKAAHYRADYQNKRAATFHGAACPRCVPSRWSSRAELHRCRRSTRKRSWMLEFPVPMTSALPEGTQQPHSFSVMPGIFALLLLLVPSACRTSMPAPPGCQHTLSQRAAAGHLPSAPCTAPTPWFRDTSLNTSDSSCLEDDQREEWIFTPRGTHFGCVPLSSPS